MRKGRIRDSLSIRATRKLMYDGRVQLILALALLYLAQGFFGGFSFSSSSSIRTAYLHSVPDKKLLLDDIPVHDRESSGNAMPAVHTPFFFQALPINSADKEMLMTVKGIGPALADSILAYRENVGPLQRLEDLTAIPGVGVRRAASLAPFLLFDEAP